MTSWKTGHEIKKAFGEGTGMKGGVPYITCATCKALVELSPGVKHRCFGVGGKDSLSLPGGGLTGGMEIEVEKIFADALDRFDQKVGKHAGEQWSALAHLRMKYVAAADARITKLEEELDREKEFGREQLVKMNELIGLLERYIRSMPMCSYCGYLIGCWRSDRRKKKLVKLKYACADCVDARPKRDWVFCDYHGFSNYLEAIAKKAGVKYLVSRESEG